MKFIHLLLFTIIVASHTVAQPVTRDNISLKNTFKGKFLIGTALNSNQIWERDQAAMGVLNQHFNSVVAENCMKSASLQPQEGKFRFDEADKFVELGEKNGMVIIGHTLIWHSQLPAWFFMDGDGKNVSKTVLIARMKSHIQTVMQRYKGKIHGWDVVNEAIADNGSYRKSKFFEIIGADYIELAFRFAQEADPKAELYYNDYSMSNPAKRDAVVALVKKLKAKGIKISAVGMQGHVDLNQPSIEAFENSIVAFSKLGVKVMITEMDMRTLPFPNQQITADVNQQFEQRRELNPYVNGLPKEISLKFNNRYLDFFKLFLKHRDKISRVTFWGISDKDSWLNNWPIKGRTDYPLLFDRNYQAKPIVADIIKLGAEKY